VNLGVNLRRDLLEGGVLRNSTGLDEGGKKKQTHRVIAPKYKHSVKGTKADEALRARNFGRCG